MAEHTPGPWKCEEWRYPDATPPRVEIVIHNDRSRVAILDADEHGDNPYTLPWAEAKANARLIAVAPDLLETLEVIRSDIGGYFDGDWDGNDEGWQALANRAQKAIAKATKED